MPSESLSRLTPEDKEWLETIMRQTVTAAVKALFDVPIQPGSVASLIQPASRRDVTETIDPDSWYPEPR